MNMINTKSGRSAISIIIAIVIVVVSVAFIFNIIKRQFLSFDFSSSVPQVDQDQDVSGGDNNSEVQTGDTDPEELTEPVVHEETWEDREEEVGFYFGEGEVSRINSNSISLLHPAVYKKAYSATNGKFNIGDTEYGKGYYEAIANNPYCTNTQYCDARVTTSAFSFWVVTKPIEFLKNQLQDGSWKWIESLERNAWFLNGETDNEDHWLYLIPVDSGKTAIFNMWYFDEDDIDDLDEFENVITLSKQKIIRNGILKSLRSSELSVPILFETEMYVFDGRDSVCDNDLNSVDIDFIADDLRDRVNTMADTLENFEVDGDHGYNLLADKYRIDFIDFDNDGDVVIYLKSFGAQEGDCFENAIEKQVRRTFENVNGIDDIDVYLDGEEL